MKAEERKRKTKSVVIFCILSKLLIVYAIRRTPYTKPARDTINHVIRLFAVSCEGVITPLYMR
ncbi:MAG: hypothetical protein WC914_09295, partial [Proteiniphilum sp.]